MKKIYSKTGDDGQTALINGERLAKDSLVFEVLGTLDEFNASLGVLLANWQETFSPKTGLTQTKDIALQKRFLLDLQKQLFKLGAEIAKSPSVKLQNSFLERMEKNIDQLQNQLGKDFWSNFVLPGGSQLAAQVDLARTICRRLERRLVALDAERDLRDILIKFVNRTSDYLYILRSYINHELKVKEIPV
ncbi:cob(I)yrinic acid a,c-diamide adenosyltransferase [Candidatus Woesebacteria bacterium]|jgi:cob(I)alamin adenosyltransferase|nr:cob(I)yrinic acid a,c-diamide adenosyltransferase [Candidatus Woesebacteria bacterium]HOC07704.1 cob(I)yrinic acid a,c-diamide adenosyltransferase [Candidatus Woesebacteria bacterium]HOI05122.1 cob(I)yrinic acid a,c-diamide adenosyltransferase [Candidatus Woesebacteria bacterium]HOP38780.1 cob(I)yrinic acid a,c-diamide adenosyltransferase [Candidatus Woesebacteria bacterium]HPA61995.1 cob(I)yrinic acid a,c-diamide adenosyltransferase [Candidatus Woesebacteria bacterium]